MLLSLVVHTYSLRYWFPATIMLGSAPAYLLSWGAWRLLSSVLPARMYHKLDDRLYSVYQSMVLFFFENYTGVEIIIYGDIPKNKENVIYLSNHQCTADWIIADMLAIRQSALGHVRYVLKDGLKWLPLYGWYFSQHGGAYVKRSARFSEIAMKKKLYTQTQSGTPMYLVIFPEGTRYNPELKSVIADSQAFATKEGLAVLKHTLTPRMKASHIALEAMKDHLHAVYDVTVAYESTLTVSRQRKPAPSMPEFLCKECPRVHIHFDRVDMKEIPPEPLFFRRWLHERFEIKDRFVMAVDWIGFGYAAAIAFGGFMGYKRKGSVMSLMAGLVFGCLSAYGAYSVSYDPKDIKISLLSSGVLSLVMGMRYKKSGKLLPAGIMAGLSLLMVFRLLLLLVG
ncbi:1-acyl-sn-glycerol-3-phosphate acyltransferase epsilon isoform 3-T4 [Spinachia spinachia]